MAPLFDFQIDERQLSDEDEAGGRAPAANGHAQQPAALHQQPAALLPLTPEGVRRSARLSEDGDGAEGDGLERIADSIAIARYHYRAGFEANSALDTVHAAGHFAKSLVAWPTVATLVSLANMHLKLGGANSVRRCAEASRTNNGGVGPGLRGSARERCARAIPVRLRCASDWLHRSYHWLCVAVRAVLCAVRACGAAGAGRVRLPLAASGRIRDACGGHSFGGRSLARRSRAAADLTPRAATAPQAQAP
jgi:hypothetical protein